jgi:hypothetical protein
MTKRHSALLLLLAFLNPACGTWVGSPKTRPTSPQPGDTGTVRLTLQALTGGSALTYAPAMDLLAASDPYATWDVVSFTPVSVILPIITIAFNGNANGTIYNCPANTDAGCLVDIADQSQLDKIASSASVQAGTYTSVNVFTGVDGGNGYPVKFKGTFTTSGTTYYTAAGDVPITTDASKYDYVDVTITSGTNHFDLPNPIVVAAGQTDDTTLYVPIEDMAAGGIGTMTQGGAKYSGLDPGSVSTEIGYPVVVPALTAASPKIETYILQETGTNLYGLLQLVVDGDGNVLGGITRQAYQGKDTGAIDGFNTQIGKVTKNADGSYDLATVDSSLSFPAFQRANHSGQMSINGAAAVGYTAVQH